MLKVALSDNLHYWLKEVVTSAKGWNPKRAWYLSVREGDGIRLDDDVRCRLTVGIVWLARLFPRAYLAAIWSSELESMIEPTQEEFDAALTKILSSDFQPKP